MLRMRRGLTVPTPRQPALCIAGWTIEADGRCLEQQIAPTSLPTGECPYLRDSGSASRLPGAQPGDPMVMAML
jgi:hypothetical protein